MSDTGNTYNDPVQREGIKEGINYLKNQFEGRHDAEHASELNDSNNSSNVGGVTDNPPTVGGYTHDVQGAPMPQSGTAGSGQSGGTFNDTRGSAMSSSGLASGDASDSRHAGGAFDPAQNTAFFSCSTGQNRTGALDERQYDTTSTGTSGNPERDFAAASGARGLQNPSEDYSTRSDDGVNSSRAAASARESAGIDTYDNPSYTANDGSASRGVSDPSRDDSLPNRSSTAGDGVSDPSKDDSIPGVSGTDGGERPQASRGEGVGASEGHHDADDIMGGPKETGNPAKRENPDAIPYAGDKKVGQDHWGESKRLE